MRLGNKIKNDYENILIKKGEDYFYKYSVGTGYLDRTNFKYPELNMLDRSDAFFILFRQTGNKNYSIIGRVLRKAAHKLYRNRIRSNGEIYASCNRFIRLVK